MGCRVRGLGVQGLGLEESCKYLEVNIQILELTRFVEEPVLNLEQIFISFTFAALIQWLPTKLWNVQTCDKIVKIELLNLAPKFEWHKTSQKVWQMTFIWKRKNPLLMQILNLFIRQTIGIFS